MKCLLYYDLHYLTTRVSFQLGIQAPFVIGKEKILSSNAVQKDWTTLPLRVPDFLLWLHRALGWHAWFLSNFNANATAKCLVMHTQVSGIHSLNPFLYPFYPLYRLPTSAIFEGWRGYKSLHFLLHAEIELFFSQLKVFCRNSTGN